MGKGRQVSRGTDTALLGHDGMDPEVQEVEKALDDGRTASGVAERERIRPEQQHRANDLLGKLGPDTHGMAGQKVFLQLRRVHGRDDRRGEVAEARRHAVDDLPAGDQAIDDGSCLGDANSGRRIERDTPTAPRDVLDVTDGQRRARQDQRAVGGRGRWRRSRARGLAGSARTSSSVTRRG